MDCGQVYQLGIPLIMPSADLLVEWIVKYQLFHSSIYWRNIPTIETPSAMKVPPLDMPYHPYDLTDRQAAEWWVVNAVEYYEYPHMIMFESLSDLVCMLHEMLTLEQLKRHSADMIDWIAQHNQRAYKSWRDAFKTLLIHDSRNTEPAKQPANASLEAALKSKHGIVPESTRRFRDAEPEEHRESESDKTSYDWLPYSGGVELNFNESYIEQHCTPEFTGYVLHRINHRITTSTTAGYYAQLSIMQSNLDDMNYLPPGVGEDLKNKANFTGSYFDHRRTKTGRSGRRTERLP